MEYYKAKVIAELLLELIQKEPGIEKAEIVGSIRREKPHVKDIEILVQPSIRTEHDMFGNELLDLPASEQIDWMDLLPATDRIKNGLRYKQFVIKSDIGTITLDMFICFRPAQWGTLKVIRTGPWKFSQAAVTQERKGGYMLDDYFVSGGHVEQIGKGTVQTPTEMEFFDCLTIDYLEPKER